eukprot:1090538-Amphidinium_carterae.1
MQIAGKPHPEESDESICAAGGLLWTSIVLGGTLNVPAVASCLFTLSCTMPQGNRHLEAGGNCNQHERLKIKAGTTTYFPGKQTHKINLVYAGLAGR